MKNVCWSIKILYNFFKRIIQIKNLCNSCWNRKNTLYFCNNLQWSNHEFEFLVIDTYKTQECVEVIKKLIKVENQDDIDNILMKDSCGQWCG